MFYKYTTSFIYNQFYIIFEHMLYDVFVKGTRSPSHVNIYGLCTAFY